MYKTIRISIWKDIKDNEMFKEVVKNNKDRINDYFTVMIFSKYEEMYKKVDEIETNTEGNFKKGIEHDYQGRTLVCRQQLFEDDKEEIWGYSKAQGFIFLCDEEGLTFNTVSHEVGHAVLGYMGAYFNDKFKIKTYEDEKNEEDTLYEELFCYITGSLNNQICVEVA